MQFNFANHILPFYLFFFCFFFAIQNIAVFFPFVFHRFVMSRHMKRKQTHAKSWQMCEGGGAGGGGEKLVDREPIRMCDIYIFNGMGRLCGKDNKNFARKKTRCARKRILREARKAALVICSITCYFWTTNLTEKQVWFYAWRKSHRIPSTKACNLHRFFVQVLHILHLVVDNETACTTIGSSIARWKKKRKEVVQSKHNEDYTRQVKPFASYYIFQCLLL